MKLSNIQKKLDPNILEKGRKSLKLKCMYPFFWMFISFFPIFLFTEYLDEHPNGDNILLYYIFFVAMCPNIVGLYFTFTDPFIKYFRSITESLKINRFALRPFTKEELSFIKKNFKKVKWKFSLQESLNVAQNLKDEAQIDVLQDKELEKDYIVNTNFTEIDDIEMKKLQTLYYVIIGVSGVIIYSFINA